MYAHTGMYKRTTPVAYWSHTDMHTHTHIHSLVLMDAHRLYYVFWFMKLR